MIYRDDLRRGHLLVQSDLPAIPPETEPRHSWLLDVQAYEVHSQQDIHWERKEHKS